MQNPPQTHDQSNPFKNAAHSLKKKLKENDKRHATLWETFFESKSWLQLAVDEYGVNPVLVGADLGRLYKGKHLKNPNIVLLADDRNGDLRFREQEFFRSLQKHTYDKNTREVKLKCGIKLNVTQVVSGTEEVQMEKIQQLFKEDRPLTSYCFWLDPLKRLRDINRPIGLDGEATEDQDFWRLSMICCLRLSLYGQPTQQQVFQVKTLPEWFKYVYENGENSGTIVKFSYCDDQISEMPSAGGFDESETDESDLRSNPE